MISLRVFKTSLIDKSLMMDCCDFLINLKLEAEKWTKELLIRNELFVESSLIILTLFYWYMML